MAGHGEAEHTGQCGLAGAQQRSHLRLAANWPLRLWWDCNAECEQDCRGEREPPILGVMSGLELSAVLSQSSEVDVIEQVMHDAATAESHHS